MKRVSDVDLHAVLSIHLFLSSFLEMRDQVLHPYKTRGRIMVLISMPLMHN
jgi:hypothetical protein